MAGLGENEFLQLQIDPGDGEDNECGVREVGSERFNQFTLFLFRGFLQELAEVVVVDGVLEAVVLSGLFKVGNWKNCCAEDLLELGSFLGRYSQMASELEIDDGQNGSHAERVREPAG